MQIYNMSCDLKIYNLFFIKALLFHSPKWIQVQNEEATCQNRLNTIPNNTKLAGTNNYTVAVRTQKGQMSPSDHAVGTNNTFDIHFPFMLTG